MNDFLSEVTFTFSRKTPARDIYDTLEAACFEIATWGEAIYSVLMAKAQTQLPGDGFFDNFRIHREDEYKKIAEKQRIVGLSLQQKISMADFEKSRVYSHSNARQL